MADPSAETAPAPASAPRRTRVRVGELLSAGGAAGLLVVLLGTEWYGVAGVPDPSAARPAISGAENGWHGLPVTRWVLLATIVLVLGSVALHASQRGHGTRTETGRPIAALGSVSALLLVVRVLIVLPSATKVVDQKLGAVLGLGFALMIAWGGFESVREERARARTGTRRVAAATALARRRSGR